MRVRLPKLLTYQQEIVDKLHSDTRFVVYCAGRRTGKSVLGIHLLVLSAIQGRKVAYFGLTHKSIKTFYETTLTILSDIVSSSDSMAMRLKLVTGGVIHFWFLEQPNVRDRIRGQNYDLLVIDEAAHIPNLLDIWNRVLRATLIDTQGKALFISSPNGYNSFYELYQNYEQGVPGWYSTRNTTYDNYLLDRIEVDSLRDTLPTQVFNSEILAQFVSTEGTVFRNLSNMLIESEPTLDNNTSVSIGVDLARTTDNSAFVVMQGTYILDILVLKDTSFYQQKETITNLYNQYNPDTICIERNGLSQQLVEELIESYLPIVPFTTTSESKKLLVEDLAAAVETGIITVQKDTRNVQTLIQELAVFESKSSNLERVTYSAPNGYHDDTVIALALAYKMQKESSGSVFL